MLETREMNKTKQNKTKQMDKKKTKRKTIIFFFFLLFLSWIFHDAHSLPEQHGQQLALWVLYIYVESPYLTIGCFMYTWKGNPLSYSLTVHRYAHDFLLNLITHSLNHFHNQKLVVPLFIYIPEALC